MCIQLAMVEMWSVVTLLVLLHFSLVASEVSVHFKGKVYSNHSVVRAGQIGKEENPLECRVSKNTECCWNETSFQWYFPNGTQIGDSDNGNFVYITRGGQDQQWASVYLHRKSPAKQFRLHGGLGLYRCEIPASGARGAIQTIYVGLYFGDDFPTEGRPNVTGLEFHLDEVNTNPFQSGVPEFSLTCTSSCGPATNVKWKLGNEALTENSNHTMTRTLVDQLGPDYSSTLTVTGRTVGNYSCNVSNSKGYSMKGYKVEAANPPTNLTAVQVDATTVLVSWTAPTAGATPSGYRIFYQAEGDHMFTTVDTEKDDTEHLLPRTTYNFSVVTLSQHNLPSHISRGLIAQALEGEVTPTSVRFTWDEQPFIDSYEILFDWDTGSRLTCPSVPHSGTYYINSTTLEYNLTDLHEYSQYSVTVKTVNKAGSSSSTFSVTTLQTRPSGPPQNVIGTADTSAITVQWQEVKCIDQNSEITNYSVTYGNMSNNDTLVVPAETRTYTINGLMPFTNYSIEVAAVNTAGQVGPKATIVVETLQETGGSPSGATAVTGAVVGVLLAVLVIIAVVAVVVCIVLRCKLKARKFVVKDKGFYNPGSELHATVVPDVDEKLSKPAVEKFPERHVHVKEGETILFQVQVTGTPAPSLTWYFNDEEVVEDYSLTLVEGGTLTIPTAESRHGGVYRLVAMNPAGFVTKETCVTVLGEGELNPLAPKMTFRPIPLPEFGEYVALNHANSNQGFHEQYESLETGSEHPMAIGLSSQNKKKNRFKRVAVYDDNRIDLQPLAGHKDCQDAYINACYVNGYSLKNKFIAAQGPIPTSLVDFWRLVWQEKVPTIVMVANVFEGGKLKCSQYWPDSGTKSFGPFQIAITDQQVLADYIVRVFQVTLTDGPDHPVKVTQYHYIAWPDHGVPEYATSMLEFCQRVKTQHNTDRGPLLVHCSAGVGRTGTLIAIDCVLEQVERERVVDIAGTINKLRHQRTKMVQTVNQYILIHDATLEAVTCGNTQIPVGDMYIALGKLREVDPKSGITGMELQFQLLEKVTPKPDELSRNTAFQHQDKNRNMDFIPSDRSRVSLKGEHPDYIHASFVDGYKQRKAFIIAQGPMKSTCRDFWKMVHDRKCGAIVMLSQLREDGKEVCSQYWPDSDLKEFDDTEVELLSVELCDGYISRTLKVTKSRESHRVIQFHIENWTSSAQCSKFSSVLEVIEEMGKVQRKTGNTPVVVHCSDTVSRSGMFCAIATTIEKCKAEGVVDVFQIVKVLRLQKPGAVFTVEQYCSLFDVMTLYLDSFNAYDNFK